MTKTTFDCRNIWSIQRFETDTQVRHGELSYKQQGPVSGFLFLLYFNDAAVDCLQDMGIPIRVLDRHR